MSIFMQDMERKRAAMKAYREANKEELAKKAKARRKAKTPEEMVEVRRKQAEGVRAWRNGMTVAELRAFLAEHNHQCDICGAPEKVIDHDHKCCGGQTPKIAHKDRPKRLCGKCKRGLLCHACNNALGQMQDDPARLRAAADYLERKK